MSRIDGPESDGAGSDEQVLIGKGERPLQRPCWGWSRYALCSGDPPTSNLVESIIKGVDFRQKSSSSRRAAPLLQGTSNPGSELLRHGPEPRIDHRPMRRQFSRQNSRLPVGAMVAEPAQGTVPGGASGHVSIRPMLVSVGST